jgi:hypothetical protein
VQAVQTHSGDDRFVWKWCANGRFSTRTGITRLLPWPYRAARGCSGVECLRSVQGQVSCVACPSESLLDCRLPCATWFSLACHLPPLLEHRRDSRPHFPLVSLCLLGLGRGVSSPRHSGVAPHSAGHAPSLVARVCCRHDAPRC